MTEKKLYTCDICHTDYADKVKATECEKNHKLLEHACIIGEYKSQKQMVDGVPYKIKVKFKDCDKFIEYHK